MSKSPITSFNEILFTFANPRLEQKLQFGLFSLHMENKLGLFNDSMINKYKMR